MHTGSETNNGLVVDLELGARLAGNKPELAKELLFFLVKNLPNEISEIQQAHKKNNIHQLKKLAHKLSGAINYCGTPRLKHVLARLETVLKQNETQQLDAILADVAFEADQVIQKVSEIGAKS